ncbi:membrane fusion protein, adhesin transport system [Tistlia consotensis]|uniref:Membrane fusion protein (MFP) family protein n=1 Tax=Tistlia consotensis USBA 355 TaxID=560819 RepID=A0A1Y6CP03_9PROT|nr:HlyD family type I secretion periplasmic adaptor subunit [Tistlia consotensis]SMF62986.1 membrane fusion protein, adhesin transport system [Tistlia consotensis USBA 355]SNR95373.1 membrane fusion protein, adhesin transport system [Tistlia consotensis]
MSDPERKEPTFGLPVRRDSQLPAKPRGQRLPALWSEKGLRARYVDFLPDAQAVVEREHSPVARILLFVLSGLFLLFLAYISVAKVDQVATGQGVVRPFGEVKVINHPVGGRISKLYVRDGDLVNQGAPLVELDPELTRQEVGQLQTNLDDLDAQTLRLEAEATDGELQFPQALIDRRPEAVQAQINLFNARRNAIESKLATAREVVAQRQQAVAGQEQRIGPLTQSLAILRDQAKSIKALVDKGYFPAIRYQSIQRQVVEADGQRAQAESDLATARAALKEAENNLDSQRRDWQSKVLDELATAMSDREKAKTRLAQQSTALRNLVLRAPVDGVVQDLAVTSAGQSVGANQPILKVVPVGDSLIVEAKVRNADIGFIQVGMPAQVKVETYNYIKYGLLKGEVERISADAMADQKSGALYYEVEVRTRTTSLTGPGGRPLRVLPGMQTQVDFKIGRRTIFAFLTDRLRQTASEALREH